LKQHKALLAEDCSELSVEKKQGKLHWMQDPSEINAYKLSNPRREVCGNFRNKKREYLKNRINELASLSNKKSTRELHRQTNEFKKGYQHKTNLVMGGNVTWL
jgi:hypothetical protein